MNAERRTVDTDSGVNVVLFRARCHRIGQTRPVMVYRLVTAGTVDQKIVERAAAKRRLEKMIIHSGKFKSQDKDGLKKTMEAISPQVRKND